MNGLRMGLLSALIGSSAAAVAPASAPHQYKLDIPREPLAAALVDFARETGLQVARFSDVGELTVVISPVAGLYTAEQALHLMLADSGFSYRFVNERTIAIVRLDSSSSAPPQDLSTTAPVPSTPSQETTNTARKHSGLFARLAALLVALGSGGVAAQTDAPTATSSQSNGELQEVVVTAQRRSERLQDVPISVQAFDTKELEASGISNTADLPMLTPGLVFGQQTGLAQPFLRGIGTVATGAGIENPVALYIDGVYYSAVIGSGMSLTNIEQIEVDKGPQGTLFGRNATGGLIQITTKEPSQTFGGSVGATYGNYATSGTDVYLTGGVTSDLAADLAVHFQNQGDGFGKNLYTGQPLSKTQDLATRNKWLLTTSDGTQLKLILDYEQTHYVPNYTYAPGTTALGAPPYPVPPQDTAGIYQPFGDIHQGGASFHIQHDFDFGQFISISAYRRTNAHYDPEASLSIDPAYALNIDVHEVHNQITQEFQLLSQPNSRVKWTVGSYLYDADAGITPPMLITGGLIAPLTYLHFFERQKSYSAAAYGQATTEVLPATNLTVGLRYTVERRDFRGDQAFGFPDGSTASSGDAQHKIFDKPTWRFALDHHFSPDLMGYVSYNRGFKSGGFNDALIPTVEYQPEVLDAYEVGAKTSLFEHHLSLNATGFFYDYKEIQEIQYLQQNGTGYVYNGATARLYGLDLDAKLKLFGNLSFTAALEIIHSYFSSFPNAAISTPIPGGGTAFATGSATGNTLPFTPDSSLSVTADYVIPTDSLGDLTLSATDAYSNGWYAEPDNRLHQPSYNLVNAQISWNTPGDIYKVRLWGKNLTDTQYTTSLGSQANGDFAVFAAPRTYGLTVLRNF